MVQESFLKAFEKLSTFRFQSAFKSWLYRIAINTAKNRLRKKKPTVSIEKVTIEVENLCESELIEFQLMHKVRGLVEELPERQKVALELRVYNELSFKQVAAEMNCPYDTAKANYRHGMIKIREMMEEAI